ncbi:MAG: HAD family hydrolase [Sedimentisphaerales bacterium]|jgi:HAD superfamily hydrolase (TIGR01549 family)
MGKTAIRAITFDLWDTVFIDDSDEPKRAAQGLPPKPVERRNLVHQFLERHAPISRGQVEVAYDTVDAAFRQVWYGQNVTWTVRERLSVLLEGLKRDLPAVELDELIRLHEEMELAVRPDLASDIAEALGELEGKYRIGVVSDAIFSPGRALRRLLGDYGILKFFSAFVFSDEIGCAKPNPASFEAVAKALEVELCEIVHIGDRELKDIEGPHAVGAHAVLCTVVKDRGSDKTQADAVCNDFADLPAILEELHS